MISYVLVMIVSLSTGLPLHASLQGPMATDWCEQLIRQARYVGGDGTTRNLPACLSEPEARRTLEESSCRRHPGPSPHWPSIEFDCAGATTATVVAGRGAPPDAEPAAPDSATAVTAAVSGPPGSTEPVPPPPPAPPSTPPAPTPLTEGAPPPERPVRLGAAASALVTQAHAEAWHGRYGAAAATIERALRIEPENPLLWIELGEVRMEDGQPAQADGLYRKALALASGDSPIEARVWRLLAQSLRARGRDLEAAEAERQAASAQPR